MNQRKGFKKKDKHSKLLRISLKMRKVEMLFALNLLISVPFAKNKNAKFSSPLDLRKMGVMKILINIYLSSCKKYSKMLRLIHIIKKIDTVLPAKGKMLVIKVLIYIFVFFLSKTF